jgi:hypothetical protein
MSIVGEITVDAARSAIHGMAGHAADCRSVR